VNRLLVALAACLFRARGRHHLVPGTDDTLVFPRVPPGDDEDQGDEKTRFDLSRARPYVDRREPPEMIP